MSVSSVGGAASLPVPLPTPAPPLPAPSGATAEPAPSGSAARPPGDVRAPGRAGPAEREIEAAREKEKPKPEPLPPLRGLSVAEFRVMLGVGMPPATGDDADGAPQVASLKAAMDRYA
jgi:hypothetical protein